jgi:uncharacterized protein (DUF1501 family)
MNLQTTIKEWNATLPAWFPRVAFAPVGQAPRGDVLVCIFQRGGMDGLNAIVPVGDSDYYKLRTTIAVPQPKSGDPQTAIDLDGYFGLHPALAPLKPLYDTGVLAMVHASGSPDPTHSHFDAMDYMERGTPGSKTVGTGWLARHILTLNNGNTSPIRAVGIGAMLQEALRGEIPAVAFGSIANFHLRGRTQDIAKLQKALAALYAISQASNPLLQNAASEIEDISHLLTRVNVASYKPTQGSNYPKGSFATGMMQIAQLIKAEVGLEVACVDLGGWDTHSNEGGAQGQLARLLGEFGQTLAAFYNDLGDRTKNVTVVTMSEFGRRAQENGSGGTDHGHANAMFLLGGGIKGGKVYGDWPTLAADKLAAPGDLALTTDYRDILAELVTRRLGNPAIEQVFPNYTPSMRGLTRPLA